MALTKLNNQSLSAVTSAGFPSGAVVNMEHYEITASSTRTSATAFADDIVFTSYTPVLSNSTVIVQGVAAMQPASSTYLHLKWVVDGTDYLSTGTTPTYTYNVYSGSGGNNRLESFTIFTSVSNTDGSAIPVKVQAKTSSGTLYINRAVNASTAGAPSSVTYIEIAN